MKTALATIAILLFCTCTTPPSATMDSRLVGTWQATGQVPVRVTYAPDGTWASRFAMDVDGASRAIRATGTWRIENGAIHNTILTCDDMPGAPPIELPYLSVEKIVSLAEREYRYVCPVQGSTNTMRRVNE